MTPDVQSHQVGCHGHQDVAVRTVTYRLDRIKELTGYDAADPIHRFTLHAAVLGARVLGWPGAPLPTPGG
jgi:sugar diacid utilization regulator